MPSVRPSSTSRVSRVPSGLITSTLPLPESPATASTGSTSALVARSVTTCTVAVAPLMSCTPAGAVHTSRSPVASEPVPVSPPPGSLLGSTTGGPVRPGAGCCLAAGGGGTVPAGSAAIVPSTVHGNGPGPFLICARTESSLSEIWYACPPSMSATSP